jgi:hypothetical protein
MTNNDYAFEIAACRRDGAMWLEEVVYTPATRWEPEDADIIEQPCPVCGGTDVVYPDDSMYGALAVAALYAAQCVGLAIEYAGLPDCQRCGRRNYDGGSTCWSCTEEYWR